MGALLAEAYALLLLPSTWFVGAVVLVSGIVRGFSGFGGALIFIPLTASILGPVQAVAIFYLFDLVSATIYGYTFLPKSRLSEVLPMVAGAAITVPVGVWILAYTDPLLLRWFIAFVVILLLAILVSGWRYRGQPTSPISFGLGLIAGVFGGSTGMSGPVVIAYWLSSPSPAAVVRANIMAFYAVTATITDIFLFYKGLFTWATVVYALLAWPLYTAGLALGARVFKGSSEAQYRMAAYLLILFAAMVSLPLFDRWLR